VNERGIVAFSINDARDLKDNVYLLELYKTCSAKSALSSKLNGEVVAQAVSQLGPNETPDRSIVNALNAARDAAESHAATAELEAKVRKKFSK